MNYLTASKFFADSYNCGAYGNGGFNENQCASVVSGGLSNTGTDVTIGIGVGILLIVVAVILILRNRKKK